MMTNSLAVLPMLKDPNNLVFAKYKMFWAPGKSAMSWHIVLRRAIKKRELNNLLL